MAAVIVGEERYVFDCEWYDQQAELIRYYRITFYPTDQTIEMYDKKNERMFLKRCPF
jgi:nucleoside-diphosphate kinase